MKKTIIFTLSVRPECSPLVYLELVKKEAKANVSKGKKRRTEKNKKFIGYALNIIVQVTLYLFVCGAAANPFAYDSAALALKKEEWNKAYEMLVPLVIDNPDNADVLYDAGVAAYKMKKYAQAITYFVRSAQHANQDQLKIHAYFNAGNASVETKELHKAIEHFDAVLAIAPEHVYAKHNKERVLEMLRQQEQQKQQEQQNKEQNDQSKQQEQQNQDKNQENQGDQNQDNQQGDAGNQGNKQNNNDKTQNGDNKSEANNNSSQNNKSEQSSSNESSDSSEKQSDQKERGDSTDGGQSNERKNKRNEQQHAADSNNDEKRDGEHNAQQNFSNAEDQSNSEQSNNHNETPQKQNNDTSGEDSSAVASKEDSGHDEKKQEAESEQAQQTKEEMSNLLNEKLQDPLLVNILQKQEERDRATNKQLMQTKIQQNGGKNGQNCW